jgi:collagen beta-1,O-galactosyltransferase
LSHYMIWEEMEENDIYLILEDDIRFGPHFTRQIQNILKEAETIDWDLIYVGRKRGPGAAGDVEKMVTENISTATYSYWTLGYIISGKAAKILVDEKPLSKMVPVDEYLPIMYGAHKEDKYNRYFNNRILKAFSAEPVLVQPTHYTGQVNYVTDTEPDDEKDILFKNKDEL